MEHEVEAGPEGDLVLLQRAVDHDRVAQTLRRRIRGMVVAGAALTVGWGNPLSLPMLLFGDGALLWSVRRLERSGDWQRAVVGCGLGLMVVGFAGVSATGMMFSGWMLAYLVGVAGFGLLTSGYLRVLRGRAAANRAYALRHEVSLRQLRRSEQARHETPRRRAEEGAAAAAGKDLAPSWPGPDVPAPLPGLPPWEQAGMSDPDDGLPGGPATRERSSSRRRPDLDRDHLRPGFHGWDNPDKPPTPPSGSDDQRSPDASDPPSAI